MRRVEIYDGLHFEEPRGVGEVSLKFWRTCKEALSGAGRLSPLDEAGLDLLAHAHHDREKAIEALNRDGYFVVGEKGVSLHPAVNLKGESSRRLTVLCSKMGLTTMARAIKMRQSEVTQDVSKNEFMLLAKENGVVNGKGG